MAKPKFIFWLKQDNDVVLQRRTEMLRKHNFHVVWLPTIEHLGAALSQNRAFALIISEYLQVNKTCDVISKLIEVPELRGCRFLLSLEHFQTQCMEYAACSNFRDMIPSDIDDKSWLFRVLFSVAAEALDYAQPSGQISLAHHANIRVPARIIWFDREKIRLESQLLPEEGANIAVTGHIAKLLQAKEVRLKVLATENSQLTFRFSNAIIAQFQLTEPQKNLLEQLHSDQKKLTAKPKRRAFIAVKDVQLRQTMQERLSALNFICNSALQLKSLTLEPKYFSPDIVILEHSLADNEQYPRFQKMLEILPPECVVIIYEGNQNAFEILKRENSRYNLHWLKETEDIESVLQYLPSETTSPPNQVFVDGKNPISKVLFRIPTKITALHPQTIQLVTSLQMKRFAICQLDSPLLTKWLQKTIWLKITQVRGNTRVNDLSLPHCLECLFITLPHSQTYQLSLRLLKLYTAHLTKHFLSVEQQDYDGEIKTLEVEKNAPLHMLSPPESSKIAKHTSDIKPKEKVEPKRDPDEIIREVLGPLETGTTRGKRKAPLFFRVITSDPAIYIFCFILITAIMLEVLDKFVPYLAQNYKKSGSVYVESLKKFTDHNTHEHNKKAE